jgi:hypothetical protein
MGRSSLLRGCVALWGRMRRVAGAGAAAAALLAAGCGGGGVPDPRTTAAELSAAAARGDSAAVYALLTDDARRALGAEGTRRLLEGAREEIARRAKSAASPSAVTRIGAEVRYDDGERALVSVEEGHFRVSAAAGLPSRARTPAEALGELRGALARRSYAALVRALSTDTRDAVERDLGSLVTGLTDPDSLVVKVHGETAEVDVPGGHKVILKREAGVWHVLDFD